MPNIRRRYPYTQRLDGPGGRPGGTPTPPTTIWPPDYEFVDDEGIVLEDYTPDLEYKYEVYRSLSREFVGELPVGYSNYGRVLNAPGGGELHLPNQTDRTFDTGVEILYPGRFEDYEYTCMVVRNDTPVWEGFIARTNTASLDQRISFALIGLWDFFRGRFVRPSYVTGAQDLFTIIRGLVDHAQTMQPSSQLSITTGSELSGVITDLTVNDYDFKYYGDIIEDLAGAENGFDFRIEHAFSVSGEVLRTFKLGYPKIGVRREIVLEWGMNMYEYTYATDGSTRPTRIWGIGAGEGPSMALALAEDTSTFGRIPLREDIISHKEIAASQQSQLQAMTDGERRKYSQPVELVNCTIYGGDLIGTFIEGDSVQVRIDDGYTQVDKWMRVLSYTVRVQHDLLETIDVELGPEFATGG